MDSNPQLLFGHDHATLMDAKHLEERRICNLKLGRKFTHITLREIAKYSFKHFKVTLMGIKVITRSSPMESKMCSKC